MNVDRIVVSLKFALAMKFLVVFAFFIGALQAATIPTRSRGFINPVTFRGNQQNWRNSGFRTQNENRFALSSSFSNFQPSPQQNQISQGRSASTGDATILNKNFRNSGSNYQWEFETSDGTKRVEEGEVKKIGDSEGIVMRGEYSYVGPDGNTYRVTYVADENGFRPSGSHLVGI